LKEGSCCDPVKNGTLYSGPISIGATEGSYCLSFYGEISSGTSPMERRDYEIYNSLPLIQTKFTKIQYQTTQLPGQVELNSGDFGKSNHSAGVVNWKGADPGTQGLNLNCENIVTNYIMSNHPSLAIFMAPIDLANLELGYSVIIPFRKDHLAYGDNHITSYVSDLSQEFDDGENAGSKHACSTTKVVLKDFEFFVPESTHSEATISGHREFQGSFVSYGFAELEESIYRSPAGLAKDTNQEQELHIGSFGIFY